MRGHHQLSLADYCKIIRTVKASSAILAAYGFSAAAASYGTTVSLKLKTEAWDERDGHLPACLGRGDSAADNLLASVSTWNAGHCVEYFDVRDAWTWSVCTHNVLSLV